MSRHITIRMAWHDNGWNGRLCKNPSQNTYCIGNHSLLSDRLRRRKNTEIEQDNALVKLDQIPGYQPPCFWTSNAFSEHGCKITFVHPFGGLSDKTIDDHLDPYSVYSWPFRLSFNHNHENKDLHGKYPPDLEERIERYLDKFDDTSLVFFYLNYDNPISADEYKYALVGVSLLKKVEHPKYFSFDKEEIEKLRSKPSMQNCPKINWAIPFTHQFEEWGIVLPYNTYLELAKEDPSKYHLLDEMKILIEDPNIIPYFKYVSSDIDDDIAIYLLYKIKKSLQKIREDRIVDVTREEKILDKLIEHAWKKRGLYPSLPIMFEIMADIPNTKTGIGQKVIDTIKENIHGDRMNFIFDELLKGNTIPDYLENYKNEIHNARHRTSILFSDKLELLKKLCLFEFTRFQLDNIIGHKIESYKKELTDEEIIENPYLLCENYISKEPDLDQETIEDFDIDFLKIDIGMFPDFEYLDRNLELQNLIPESPERLRPLITKYLYSLENQGDCFATIRDVHDYVLEYPLFYKEKLEVTKDLLVKEGGAYDTYFRERFDIIEKEGEHFLYLKEIKKAEKTIKNIITGLVNREPYNVEFIRLERIINEDVRQLEERIQHFDTSQFIEERSKLFNNVLKRSFYIISGKAGSGKTYLLKQIVDRLHRIGEDALLLAPTGKAALRLKQLTREEEAQTIDRFLYKNGFGKYLENFEYIIIDPPRGNFRLDNLIIDESSMVDLKKLTTLFSALKILGPRGIKRIIMVGDEHQLPPIGFGRPFYDIIQFIKSNEIHKDENYICLRTNCRHELDEKILEFADVFIQKNRYYEPLFEALMSKKRLSAGFNLIIWENREELMDLIDGKIEELFGIEDIDLSTKEEGLNLLFGTYGTGYVKRNQIGTLNLDSFQLLSPYRSQMYGTIGLNEHIKTNYKSIHPMDYQVTNSGIFNHSDKIIRINNWYKYRKQGKYLFLSNGSIGIINNKRYRGKRQFHYYFIDKEKAFYWIDGQENFELAYAITIHKAQGSDFKNVFLIIPRKPSLLSKELLYTALTRSTHRVYLFLEKSEETTPLEYAKRRSDILKRNTSIFIDPEDSEKLYEPEQGIEVSSKIEYIIYRSLMEVREAGKLDFAYEQELEIKTQSYNIHPDFTIWLADATYYWEHLGILDVKDYYNKWQIRKEDYKENKLYENLITTDDLNGVKEEAIKKVIHDILNKKPRLSEYERFSKHHYELNKIYT